eukprot:ANDGO_01137.mRNA.1 hypothetical protein
MSSGLAQPHEYAILVLRNEAFILEPFTSDPTVISQQLQSLKPERKYNSFMFDSVFENLSALCPVSEVERSNMALRLLFVYSRSCTIPSLSADVGHRSRREAYFRFPKFAMDGLFLHFSTLDESKKGLLGSLKDVVNFFFTLSQECAVSPYWFETGSSVERVNHAFSLFIANSCSRYPTTNMWKIPII